MRPPAQRQVELDALRRLLGVVAAGASGGLQREVHALARRVRRQWPSCWPLWTVWHGLSRIWPRCWLRNSKR